MNSDHQTTNSPQHPLGVEKGSHNFHGSESSNAINYEFTTETESRAFWHHLYDQMGFERFCASCSIKLENGIYSITVKHA